MEEIKYEQSQEPKQKKQINFSELLLIALTRGNKPFNWTSDDLLLSRIKNTYKKAGISLEESIDAGIEQTRNYNITGKYYITKNDNWLNYKIIPLNTEHKYTIGEYKYTNKCSIGITIANCGSIYVSIVKYNVQCFEILKYLGPINISLISNPDTDIEINLMDLQLPDNIINLETYKHNLKIFKFPKYLQIFSNHSYISNNFINILPDTLKILNTTNTLQYLQNYCNYPPGLQVFIYNGYSWSFSNDSGLITDSEHIKFINKNNVIRIENLPHGLKKAYFKCELAYNQNLFPVTLEELYVDTLLYNDFILLPGNLQTFYVEKDLLYFPELSTVNLFNKFLNREHNYSKKKYLQINENLKNLLFNNTYDLFNMMLNANLHEKIQNITILHNNIFNIDTEQIEKTFKELGKIYNTIKFNLIYADNIFNKCNINYCLIN